jgi:hypothetical protein
MARCVGLVESNLHLRKDTMGHLGRCQERGSKKNEPDFLGANLKNFDRLGILTKVNPGKRVDGSTVPDGRRRASSNLLDKLWL